MRENVMLVSDRTLTLETVKRTMNQSVVTVEDHRSFLKELIDYLSNDTDDMLTAHDAVCALLEENGVTPEYPIAALEGITV